MPDLTSVRVVKPPETWQVHLRGTCGLPTRASNKEPISVMEKQDLDASISPNKNLISLLEPENSRLENLSMEIE